MGMFQEENKKKLSEILNFMVNPVKIVLFTGNSPKNEETKLFLQEFVEFCPKLSLTEYDFDKDEEAKREWGVFDSPAVFVTTENKSLKGIVFYGSPGGYEINSLLTSIIEVSGAGEELSEEQTIKLRKITKPIDVYVYVSLTCPLCPYAVMNAHKLALCNSNIKSFMVETPAFKSYAEKFKIEAMPTITINNTEHRLIGKNAQDIDQLIDLLIQCQ